MKLIVFSLCALFVLHVEGRNFEFNHVKGAVVRGDKNQLGQLMSEGASPNMVGPFCNQSLLQWAVRSGQTEMVKMLLDKGADPNFKRSDNGQTALMMATTQNKPVIAKILIANNADKNLKDNSGKSAVDIAKDGDMVNFMTEIF